MNLFFVSLDGKTHTMKWYGFEQKFELEGYKKICGIDEAGRGCLAGPVVASAVILKKDVPIEGIDDSKSISRSKRERLFDLIVSSCVNYSIAEVSHEQIDKINILNATFLAMKKAVEGLRVTPDILLVDGNLSPNFGVPSRCIIKGDTLCSCIAAASILSKVHRDNLMVRLDSIYPAYGFKKHKGYGTKEHKNAIKENKACFIHRKSFKLG